MWLSPLSWGKRSSGVREDRRSVKTSISISRITMFPNHDQKSEESQRDLVPACLEGQPTGRHILLLGLRLLPSALLPPVTWPISPHSLTPFFGPVCYPKGRDGHFGKEGGARQRHALRKTGHSRCPFHSPFSPVFFNLSFSTGSFPVEHKCASLYLTLKFLRCLPSSSSLHHLNE